MPKEQTEGDSAPHQASPCKGEDVEATTTISVPSFLDSLAFYPDSRLGFTDHYLLELNYPKFPYISPVNSRGTYYPAWQGLVFYLNHEPDITNKELITANNHQPENIQNTIKVIYPTCGSTEVTSNAYVFALSADRCGGGGGLNTFAGQPTLEDNHVLLNLSATKADTTFTPSDYLTVGYYDFIRAGGGTQDLALIATEKKHYEFSATRPTQAAPTSPASLAIEFDPLRSRIGVHSGTSTDPDSLDNSLRYQANISSSGIFAESDWQPLANLAADLSVIFGNTYKVAVRALDDFGNISTELVQDWLFPEGYAPSPKQTIHDTKLAETDRSRIGQRIHLGATTTISEVALWISQAGPGWYCCSESSLTIFKNNSENQVGDTVVISAPARLERGETEGERVYRFSPALELVSGDYWLVPARGPNTDTNNIGIYGSSDPTSYGDGYFGIPDASGVGVVDSGKDAYFLLR